MKLTDNQDRLLDALDATLPATVPMLADHLGTSAEGAARTASSLVQRGLAERLEVDGRVAYLLAGTRPVGEQSPPESSSSHSEPRAETLIEQENRAAALTEEQAASLALLRHIGGKAYVGPADLPTRNTIAKSSVEALERLGLVTLQQRPNYAVAVLVGAEA